MKLMTKKKLSFPPLNFPVLLIIFFIFVGVRLIHLTDVVNFGSDAGRDFLATWNMYQQKQPTLIGPPSQYTIHGREFFFGPAPYYLILPALLLGKWDPIAVSYFLIILNGIVLVASLFIISKYIKEHSTLYLYAAIFTFTPAFVSYSQSYWNPYFMLPVAMLLTSLLVISEFRKKSSAWLYVIIGFLWGLGMQFHYAFILALLASLIWLINSKKISVNTAIGLLGGFVLGFLPILLFEVRNHFYNLNTLLLVFSRTNDAQDSFRWHYYYVIPLEPFIALIITFLLGRFVKSSRIKLLSLLLFTAVCMYGILTLPKQKLSYPTLKNMTMDILADNPAGYNVVDQFTLDNRAMALRYMLTSQGQAPMDITQYPDSKTLYMYANRPLGMLIYKPVWELQSFIPLKKVTVRKVGDIYLYKIEK